MSYKIMPTGRTTSVELSGAPREPTACMQAALEALKFPQFEGAPIGVQKVPFTYSRTGDLTPPKPQ
jgi:hypothetical protein